MKATEQFYHVRLILFITRRCWKSFQLFSLFISFQLHEDEETKTARWITKLKKMRQELLAASWLIVYTVNSSLIYIIPKK